MAIIAATLALSVTHDGVRSLPPHCLYRADGILFVAVAVYTVLSSPLLLLGLSLLAGAWAYAFVLTSPETPITIAGFELRRREKLFALAPFSILVVTLCGLINSIVWCVVLTVLLALPHASFHEVRQPTQTTNSRPARRAPHTALFYRQRARLTPLSPRPRALCTLSLFDSSLCAPRWSSSMLSTHSSSKGCKQRQVPTSRGESAAAGWGASGAYIVCACESECRLSRAQSRERKR